MIRRVCLLSLHFSKMLSQNNTKIDCKRCYTYTQIRSLKFNDFMKIVRKTAEFGRTQKIWMKWIGRRHFDLPSSAVKSENLIPPLQIKTRKIERSFELNKQNTRECSVFCVCVCFWMCCVDWYCGFLVVFFSHDLFTFEICISIKFH